MYDGEKNFSLYSTIIQKAGIDLMGLLSIKIGKVRIIPLSISKAQPPRV
jgi:hypothetical protein